MHESPELADYMAAVREEVCSRCIERLPGAPPCETKGKGCGIELHLPQLVEICHTTDSCLIDPYLDRLHNEICSGCDLRPTRQCPCPLDYLLPLAIAAIEAVDRRQSGRRAFGDVGGDSTRCLERGDEDS